MTRTPVSGSQETSDETFYCQVETHVATKDYLRHGRCVRLIGVRPEEFSESALNDGVSTFTIDLDYWDFCLESLGLGWPKYISRKQCALVDSRDNDHQYQGTWYQLDVTFGKQGKGGKGYLYRTFSEEKEKYFTIKSLKRSIEQPTLPQFGVSASRELGQPLAGAKSRGRQFDFDTFHVGQGMCSLVHNGSTGVLLDAGAGKPVTREAYMGKTIQNDLAQIVGELEEVIAVISHADLDHWRLLGWDSALCSKVSKIYVPTGAKSLALRDKTVLSKIVQLGDHHWPLPGGSTLSVYRSAPSSRDDNGECLVSVFERGDQRVLAAGDYVYKRFKSDKNPNIKKLHDLSYSAVVVPHHGDKASANCIVRAASPEAKAFFSAGTHQGWHHPTPESLGAHTAKNFVNISTPSEPNIMKVNLL